MCSNKLKLVISIVITSSVLISCASDDKKKVIVASNPYDNSISEKKSRLLITKGKSMITDSAFIWTDDLPEFTKCKITRIKDDGYYKYFFWNIRLKIPAIYYRDSIPIVEFISDTLFDANGDSLKDLLVNGQFMNGQCAPRYANLFCFDSISNMFTNIEVISEIPNPQFFPSSRIIRGEIDCMMKKSIYRFKWTRLKLDTISIKTKPLN